MADDAAASAHDLTTFNSSSEGCADEEEWPKKTSSVANMKVIWEMLSKSDQEKNNLLKLRRDSVERGKEISTISK